MSQQQTVVANNGYNPLPTFQQNKLAWENAIAAYVGDDPLELWYNYICWYEHNVQLDTENAYEAVLGKCLSMYEYKDVFKQDQRMVKLWMKYIDLKPNALNLYQLLYQRDVGTKCTIFYIGWARYFETAGALKQAESVFNLGFQVNAQPSEDLKAAHTKFRMSLAQSMLYDDPTAAAAVVASTAQQPAAAAATEQPSTTTTVSAAAGHAKKRHADQMSADTEHSKQASVPPEQLEQQQQQHDQQQQQQQQQQYAKPEHQAGVPPEQQQHEQQQQQHQQYAHSSHQPPHYQHHQPPAEPEPSQHSHQSYQQQQQPASLPASADVAAVAGNEPQSQHPPVQYGQYPQPASSPPQPLTKRQRTHHHHHSHQHHSSHHHHSSGHSQPNGHEANAIDQQQQQHDQQHQPHHHYTESTASADAPSAGDLHSSTAHVIAASLHSVYADADTPSAEPAAAAAAAVASPIHSVAVAADDALPAGIVLDAGHCAHFRNAPDDDWPLALCVEEPYEPNKCFNYPKALVYPVGADGSAARYEYSPEEIRARRWASRLAAWRECRQLEREQATQREAERQQRELEAEERRREADEHRLEAERRRLEAEQRRLHAEQEMARQRNEFEQLRADAEDERMRVADQDRLRQAEYQRRAADVAERRRLEQQHVQSASYQQYYNLNGYQAQAQQQQQQQYHHNNTTTTTTTTSVIRTVGNANVEETFEESTIRFSTGNGHSRPKTITIKFRKEPPTVAAPEQSPSAHGEVPSSQETATDGVAMGSTLHAGLVSSAAAAPTPTKPKKEKKSKLAKRLLNGQHTSKAAAAASAAAAAAAVPVPTAPQPLHALQQLDACHLQQQQQQQLEQEQRQQLPQPTSSDDSNFSFAGSSRHATPTATNNNTKSRFDATEDDDSNSYSDYPYDGSGGGDGVGGGGGTDTSNAATSYTPTRAGHAAVAKRAFPAFATSHTSTPIRSATAASGSAAFADTPKLPHTPHNFKILKRRESSLSSSYQNDDSMCSMSSASLQNNSYFAAEHDTELQQRRLDRALETIAAHLARPLLDPFNSELCKALLTKIGFPSREHGDTYKMVSQPINKLANARLAMLANIPFQIEREVGRGSYGSVYRATNGNTGATVALKYQKPANNWELYICTEVHRRVTDPDMVAGFMDISAGIVAPNASIIVSEFSPFGSLLDINNRIRQNTKKVMHETLVMHFSMEILSIVDHLHACKIIHADIKPDNFLLMKIPDSNSPIPSVRLIDFGCAIDMKCFDENTQFMKRIETDGFTCIEMQEGRPWSYQTDIFCIAGTIHVMLLGEYMQPVKRFDQWELKNKLPRYLKKDYWLELFSTFLNMTDADHLPNLLAMKAKIGNELYKKESELQSQIRTLSNILHKR